MIKKTLFLSFLTNFLSIKGHMGSIFSQIRMKKNLIEVISEMKIKKSEMQVVRALEKVSFYNNLNR